MKTRRPTPSIASDLRTALDDYVSAERQFLLSPNSADAANALRDAERHFDCAVHELRSAPHGGWAEMRRCREEMSATKRAAREASRRAARARYAADSGTQRDGH